MVKRTVLTTVLIVGEGPTELAFLGYLKQLYLTRGSGRSVAIKNGNGGGPEHVVQRAIRISHNQSYDIRAVYMDTDLPWTEKLIADARKKKIKLIGNTPCMEGLLLKVLSKSVPINSIDCKRCIQQLNLGDLTQLSTYETIFNKALIEVERNRNPELDSLINLISGLDDHSKVR